MTIDQLKTYLKKMPNNEKSQFSQRLYFASIPNMLHRATKHSQYDKRHSTDKAKHTLIFLWTPNEKPSPAIILEICFHFFDEIILLKIPSGNQRIHYFKIKKIYQIYNAILSRDTTHILVFSFKKHYAILLDIAHKKNIKTILAEEGTASYEFLIKPDKGNLPPLTMRYILRKTRDIIHSFFIKKHPCYKRFLEPYRKFNALRLDYPQILESYIKADHVITFPFKINETRKSYINNIIEKYRYNRHDIIFASQLIWDIDFIKIMPLIVKILRQYILDHTHKRKIIFRPHPKENIALIKKHLALYQDIFTLEADISYPLEELIYVLKPKAVISIGSSSLVYGHQAYSETKYLSIASDILYLINECNLQTIRSQNFFNNIIPILKLFPHITFSTYFNLGSKVC